MLAQHSINMKSYGEQTMSESPLHSRIPINLGDSHFLWFFGAVIKKNLSSRLVIIRLIGSKCQLHTGKSLSVQNKQTNEQTNKQRPKNKRIKKKEQTIKRNKQNEKQNKKKAKTNINQKKTNKTKTKTNISNHYKLTVSFWSNHGRSNHGNTNVSISSKLR